MKKLTTLIAILLLCATTLFAQAPEKFTYQAVVRNASNTLVTNTLVGVRVSILQGSATGNGVYVETQSTTTNTNGLLSVEIGGGTVQQGSFANIDWANGPYFLKTEIDPNGGTNYSITSTQQMLSVPYALYAKESGDGFSGDYNDLTNTPTIPTIPTNVSAFTNDAGYITMDSVPAIPTNVSAFSNDAGYITGYTETDPQFNAWNKDYNDLINTPTIPTVPTNVSAFTNDAGYLTEYTETDPQFNAWDKDYNDLINTPTIPTVPTNVSAFTNDAGYLTSFTEQQVLSISNDTLFLTGGSFVKLPAGFDGDYNSLTNKPVIPTVPTNVSAFSNDAGYLTGYTETDPQFTAWDKNYNDLTNTPTIPTVPTNISAFTNDVGYLTSFTEQQVLSISNDTLFLTGGSFVKLPAGFDGDYNSLTNKPVIPTVPTNISAFTNDAGYITTYTETDPQFNAWDKDYNDLINTPTIPTVPTNVSAFTNDAGYLTSFTEQQVLSISNDTLFLTGGSFVKLPAGFDGDYNSLTNRPVIPTVPTNVSAFTNDAGYIAGYTETDPQFNAWDKDYNDLINTPTIPTVPTNVSAFTNDAGYITMDSVPAIPTNVSAFTNDAGYLTDYSEQQILTISNDTIFLSGGSFVKLPAAAAGFSGDYNDLTNKPTIPTVPTNVSAFTNDAGYLTAANVQEAANIPTNVSAFANDAGYLTEYTETDPQFNAWDKDYNDLINTPTIPTVPTNVSAFTNDAGYITSYTETDPQFNAWDKDYNDLTNKPVLFDGDYNSLTNRPVIPTVPTNVSAFTNDAGYLTSFTEQQVLSISNDTLFLTGGSFVKLPAGFDGDYNSLTNKPQIPQSVGELANDANYITLEQVPAQVNADWNATSGTAEILNKPIIPTVPTNVSMFTNDAGYITAQDIPEIPTLDEVYALIQGLQQALDSMSAALDSTQNALNEATAFRCGTSLVSDHEGNTYHTIQLGNQCWTKENMRCTTSPKGASFSALEKQTWVDEVTGEEHVMYGNWNNQAIYFNNTEINADLVTRGYLYNAWAALDTMYITGVNEWGDIYGDINFDTSFAGRRGICPKGWHLPTHSEWGELRTYVQTTYANNYFCGTASALATNEGWESQVGGAEITDCAPGSNGNGNNITRFSAYPAGFFAGWMDYDQQQYLYDTEVGYCAAFWGSGIVEVPYYPYTYPLATCWIYNWGSDIDVGSGGSSEYHSVRCLKD